MLAACRCILCLQSSRPPSRAASCAEPLRSRRTASPFFNPQNNRGEVSQEIGELDQWGGHCGRADDYHYHAARCICSRWWARACPLPLRWMAYPIYGLAEPDGAMPAGLDDFRGHETPALGYHYHVPPSTRM